MTGKPPKGWRVVELDEIAFVQTGIAINGKPDRLNPVRLPYLRVANVQDGHIDLSEIKHITVSEHQVARYSLQEGDVLMTEGGDFDKLGRGAVWRGQLAPCLHQNHVFAVRPDQTRIVPAFLAAYCESAAGKRYFLSCSKQTTNLASINSTQLKEMPVVVPPLPEQQRIVAALDAWDQAIEQTECLIVAKRQRWNILVGELSANKWPPVALGKLGRWVGGGTPSKSNTEYWANGSIPWVSPKDMNVWEIDSAEDYITTRAIAESSTQLVPAGSVLVVTRSGILRTKVPVAVTNRAVAINQDIKALLLNEPKHGPLLAALLMSAGERLRQATVKTGTTVESIDLDGLKSFQLPIPTSHDEIETANSVVVGGLNEIEFLEHQLECLRTQKRGLMQKLLTGECRLREDFK